MCKLVNWVGQCTKHELFFPKIYFVFILQLCLAPFFNFFPLSDLKYNLPQISGKIGFFRENIGFFRFFAEKSMIFPDFFSFDFFLSKSFPCRPKTDFSPKNRPKNPIFCSLVLGVCVHGNNHSLFLVNGW